MCGFSTTLIFLYPFPQGLTQMSFQHFISTGSKILGISSRVKWPGCTVCSDLTHQFVWFVAVWSSEPQRRRAFWKPGHGDDTAAGGATRVSTGTAELGAFGEAEGGEERFEAPNMPQRMKSLVDHSLWGDWMQRRRPLAGRNKDGPDCERGSPRAGECRTGSYTHTELIFARSLVAF